MFSPIEDRLVYTHLDDPEYWESRGFSVISPALTLESVTVTDPEGDHVSALAADSKPDYEPDVAIAGEGHYQCFLYANALRRL